MLENLLIAVGLSTAKAVARIWVRSELPIDIADGLLTSLAEVVPSLADRRRAARQFEEMADRIANELAPLIEHEFGSLQSNEAEAAVLGVEAVIDSVQELDTSLLLSIDLEPTVLERELRSRPEAKVRAQLAENAQLLFDRLLTENCAYIIDLAMSLPGFTSRSLVEILRRESEILDRMQEALERIPQPAIDIANEHQDFEVRYRRQVARELDSLQLFGITLSENSRRYALSTAYITLSAASSGDLDDSSHYDGAPLELGERDNAEYGIPDSDSDASFRVDDVLARGSRHLIRGEAGSGKTTLLQWLAVTAARSKFSDELAPWNTLVPIFLQLRRYANGPLPTPSAFLDFTARVLSDAQPQGWVDTVLRSGHALILIDGVDELPSHQRDEAREWLATLISEYPDCRYVVTTRPPAVPENWLGACEFETSELLPMSLTDIDAFVQHWYDAARATASSSTDETASLDRYQNELTRVIRENQAIRSLATAPLLCAMLCALNRDRRTQLPKDRMELYRIALESLLDRRDVEREIPQSDTVNLGLREKETLLQSLAFWLLLNEQSDISKSDAVVQIGERIRYISSINHSPDSVFSNLLTRSGLIREPVEGRVDFIHRTFQEYLGAARAISDGNVPLLVNKAHDDQWREVIILAAGHAPAAVADALVRGLLNRGNQEPELRHRLHLLAVACLETAIELSPDVIEAVQLALKECLPPRNMTEARAVASAGPIAVSLLTAYADSHANTAAACVRSLCLIGGEAGLHALKAFAYDPRVTVARELIRGWDYFDREDYAREVLSHSGLDYGWVLVRDVEGMAAAVHLNRLQRLHLMLPSSIENLSQIPNLELVTSLEVPYDSALLTLDGIGDCVRLRGLSVSGGHVRSVPRLPDSLVDVDFVNGGELLDISPLSDLPNLRGLRIQGASADLHQLAGASLERLVVSGPSLHDPDGSWLEGLARLDDLSLFATREVAPGPRLGAGSDLGYLAGSPGLRRLRLLGVWQKVVSIRGLPPSVRDLTLSDATELEDASAVATASELEGLRLNNAPRLRDFAFLEGLAGLRHVDLDGCSEFTDVELLSSADDLSVLCLARTGVTTLEGIGALQQLIRLELQGCQLESLEPLLELPRVAHVRIDESMKHLVTSAIQESSKITIMPARFFYHDGVRVRNYSAPGAIHPGTGE